MGLIEDLVAAGGRVCRGLAVAGVSVALLSSAPLPDLTAEAGPARQEPKNEVRTSAVVFPFEIEVESQMNMMRGAASAEEVKRLEVVTEKLRELLENSGEYNLVGYEPIAEELKDKQPLFKCNGCDADLAKAVGASQSITGTVTKASPTLINISLFVRDAESGEVVKSMAVSVRQNTDAGWARGVRWLVRNRLLKGAS